MDEKQAEVLIEVTKEIAKDAYADGVKIEFILDMLK